MKNNIRLVILIIVLLKFVELPAQKAFDDTLNSSNGKVILHVLGHASVLIEYDTLKIYVDPYSAFHNFTGMVKADMILVTHGHADHFDTSAIHKIQKPSTLMIYPQVCASMNAYKGNDTIMANGDSVNIMGLPIKAVPAYNLVKTFHPKGVGNGYVVKFGDKLVYFSGDTENVTEMADLKNIDVAFLPLNQPYNMTNDMLVSAAVVIHPKELIPYHYDNNDISTLLTMMKTYPEIKVLTGSVATNISKINKDRLTESLLLFPNPAESFLNIKNLRNNAEVTIFDINGKIVFSKIVQINELIDINQLPIGFYSLQENFNNKIREASFLKR